MYKSISALFAITMFTGPVFADQLRVVVDIPPIHGIVDGVLGSNASITTLIGSGIDPHNYTMKPSHAAALSSADLIVVIGETLTPSLAERLPSLAINAKIVELSEVQNVHLIAYKDEHEEQGHDHGDDHSGVDPHMWMDVDNADIWAHAIAKSATEITPSMAPDINANLEAFEQSLSSIKAAMQTLIAKPYSVSHDAFRYLEESLGIDRPQTVTNGMGLRPSPSDMANLRAQIEKTTPACMIIDPSDHTALAYALAEEYSVKTVEFSQLGAIVKGENAYISLMSSAVSAFKTCFK